MSFNNSLALNRKALKNIPRILTEWEFILHLIDFPLFSDASISPNNQQDHFSKKLESIRMKTRIEIDLMLTKEKLSSTCIKFYYHINLNKL
jgi:hypothetical protein